MSDHELDPFFTNASAWSRRKHRLLAKYLPPFLAKIGSRSEIIYCVDGFAGAGRYSDGTEGSPLVMARFAAESFAGKPYELRLVNVEAKRKHFDTLAEVTKPYVEKGLVSNLYGTFSSHLPQVLEITRGHPTFFFIDPYGMSVPFAELSKILARMEKTEFLLNFNSRGLRRLADSTYGKARSAKRVETLRKIGELVDTIFGSRKWREFFEPRMRLSESDRSAQSPEAEERIRQYYVRRINEKFNYNVVTYPVRESLKHAPRYYLIYGTKHFDGVKLMSKIIREEEDALIGEHYAGQLFDRVELDRAERRERLANIIETMIAAYARRKEDIIGELIPTHFAEFHDTDYTAALQDLVRRGVITKDRYDGTTTYFPNQHTRRRL